LLAVVLITIALMRFNLTALQEPGRLETLVSNRATRFVVRRASRLGIPPRPLDTKSTIGRGSALYCMDCIVCHGPDGHAQTPVGRWMYPRAADLSGEQVQSYSDRELFWIVQNGIRFTGMPAFSEVETEDHIWNLVNYVRSLPGNLRIDDSTCLQPEKQIPQHKER
jgi:mono/diheme cytochrome c family protein